MTLILDENLTPDLVAIFQKSGLKAYHVNQLKSHAKQRIIDDQLRRLTIQKGYILITKDDDFVRSYVSRKVPNKMVFLHELDTKEELIRRVTQIAPQLARLIEHYDFIEVNSDTIKFPFSD